jgi:hypothetical protein
MSDFGWLMPYAGCTNYRYNPNVLTFGCAGMSLVACLLLVRFFVLLLALVVGLILSLGCLTVLNCCYDLDMCCFLIFLV